MKQVETESGEVIWVGNGILDQCKPLYSYSIEDLRLASEIAEEMLLNLKLVCNGKMEIHKK